MSTKQASAPPKNQPRGDDYIPSPDRSKFLKEMDTLRTELSQVRASITKQKGVIEKQKADGSQSPEEQKLRDEHTAVVAELKKQRDLERKVISEAAKIEDSVKQKVSQLQLLRPKQNGPRNLKELDQKIQGLEKLVESGELSLVEESKALKEVGHLKGMRTSFGEASKLQEEIDSVRAKATELRKKFDNAPLRAASAKKQELEKKLDSFKSARKDRKSSMDALYDELRKLQTRQREITQSLDAKRAEFDAKQKEFTEKLKARKEQREQEEKKEKEEQAKSKKVEAAKAKLASAKLPAFQANIDSAKKLLRALGDNVQDEVKQVESTVNSLNRKKSTTPAAPAAPAVASAPVDLNPPSRKSLKKKQKETKSPEAVKFDFGVVEALTALNISLPTTPEEVEETKKKLLEKIKFYEENNDRVTEEKVKRAEEELEAVLKETSA